LVQELLDAKLEDADRLDHRDRPGRQHHDLHAVNQEMNMIVVVIAFLLLLAGCAAPLTSGGGSVRRIVPEAKSGCAFLGVVEVDGGFFYSSVPEARHDMHNKVRNETARLGGNAYTITDVVVERGFSLPFAQADAYRCP
jgi:hypothetical protein